MATDTKRTAQEAGKFGLGLVSEGLTFSDLLLNQRMTSAQIGLTATQSFVLGPLSLSLSSVGLVAGAAGYPTVAKGFSSAGDICTVGGSALGFAAAKGVTASLSVPTVAALGTALGGGLAYGSLINFVHEELSLPLPATAVGNLVLPGTGGLLYSLSINDVFQDLLLETYQLSLEKEEPWYEKYENYSSPTTPKPGASPTTSPTSHGQANRPVPAPRPSGTVEGLPIVGRSF